MHKAWREKGLELPSHCFFKVKNFLLLLTGLWFKCVWCVCFEVSLMNVPYQGCEGMSSFSICQFSVLQVDVYHRRWDTYQLQHHWRLGNRLRKGRIYDSLCLPCLISNSTSIRHTNMMACKVQKVTHVTLGNTVGVHLHLWYCICTLGHGHCISSGAQRLPSPCESFHSSMSNAFLLLCSSLVSHITAPLSSP